MAAKESSSATKAGGDIVITRTFNAPRELVWRAWTEPEHFMRWWGPKDFTAPSCTMDFRVGGTYLYCMRSPGGQTFWSRGVFREVVPMVRLVLTQEPADEHGNAVPATHYGMNAEFPVATVVTVTFEDDDGGTRMTLRHTGLQMGVDGARAGWNESFDKLAESLK